MLNVIFKSTRLVWLGFRISSCPFLLANTSPTNSRFVSPELWDHSLAILLHCGYLSPRVLSFAQSSHSKAWPNSTQLCSFPAAYLSHCAGSGGGTPDRSNTLKTARWYNCWVKNILPHLPWPPYTVETRNYQPLPTQSQNPKSATAACPLAWS